MLSTLIVSSGVIYWWRHQPDQPINPAADPPPEHGTITEIIDGITFRVDSGHIIRYIGVQPPQATDPVQCYSREIITAHEGLLGQTVRLESEPLLTRAADGAWSMYIWIKEPTPSPEPDTNNENVSPALSPEVTPKETLLNNSILEGGFAFPLLNEHMKYAERLSSSARFAQATQKGLWGKCHVEKKPDGQLTTQAVNDCVIKGKQVGGQKFYRLPTCPSYRTTIVLPSHGDAWLCTISEAEQADWQLAADCPAPNPS